jgi:hypothetical protein
MRNLFSFAFGVLVLAAGTAVMAQPGGARFMAFCTDGDGALSEWVFPREEAFVAGRDHERANRGHHWEVFVQQGKVAVGKPTCSVVAEDPQRPDTVRVVNTCGTCRIVKVTRRNADGTSKSKDFQIKPNTQRRFLKRPESAIVVEGEMECPDP